MSNMEFTGTFENIAQRVVFTYLKSLAALTVVTPEGVGPEPQAEIEASQRDLHEFFEVAYQAMLRQPEQFGLPLNEDIHVDAYHPEASLDKQEANRRLAKPRSVMDLGLDFLMKAGQTGRLEGQTLCLTPAEFSTCLAKPKVVRKFLQGLEIAGLEVIESKEQVRLRSQRFPAMLPALQSLATACAQYDPPQVGLFHFARCDFQALRAGYEPQALDLYRIFNPADFAYLAELHTFFTSRGYKASLNFGRMFAWVVQYQGNRKVKASPLFQVEFQERMSNPLLVQIKCASSNRITPLMPSQSTALQADFFGRINRCRSNECNWCENRKGMGPSTLAYAGNEYSVCWYTNSHVPALNDESVDLIKQYALMHEELVPLN